MFKTQMSTPGHDLAEMDAKLRALREEARTGYAKGDIRRSYIQAELTAQREARERSRREQQVREATARVGPGAVSVSCHAEDGTSPSGGVLDRSATTLLDAPWALAAEQTGDAPRATEAVVRRVAHLHHTLYPQLTTGAAGYAYSAQAAAALGQVREWDPVLGLPIAWVVREDEGSGGSGLPGGASDFLDSLADLRAAAAATTTTAVGKEERATVAPARGAWDCYEVRPRPSARLVPSPPTHSAKTSTAPEALRRRSTSRSLASTTSPSPSPSPAGLRARGTAAMSIDTGTLVTVNHARGFVAALRQRTARLRTGMPPQPQHGRDSGAEEREGSGGVVSPPVGPASPIVDARLTRVVRLVTLIFCAGCHRSFEADLGSTTSPTATTAEAAVAGSTCPHCGRAAPTREEEEKGLPHSRRPVTRAEWTAARAAEGSVVGVHGRGSDAVGLAEPTGAGGGSGSEDEGFAAAVAAVRRSLAAHRAAQAEAAPAESARVSDVAAASSTGAAGKNWEGALLGTYFLHLWDEAHPCAPMLPLASS